MAGGKEINTSLENEEFKMPVESSKYMNCELRGTGARSTHMEPSSDEG